MSQSRIASDAPLLIAGGGIGGLSTALALARLGIRARVLEAEAEFGESGAGIQIGPNGSRILRSWGLSDGLDACAARPQAIHIHDGLSGRRLASVPLGRAAETRYGAPYYVAERHALHTLLLNAVQAAPEIEIVPSFRLGEVAPTGDGIVVAADDGRSATSRALIGADGIHSRVRSLLFGAKPIFSGRNAWRATAPLAGHTGAEDEDAVQLWMAPDAHLVHYRCGPQGPLNAVAVLRGDPASPGWGTAGDAEQLLSRFTGWADEPRRRLGRFSAWMRWPLLKLRPLAKWTKGAVTLLGDAAHPIMPFLASGAVMAIEDAAVLADELSRGLEDIPAALTRYERRRLPRAAQVRQASERMGEIYHMSGVMRLARNLTLAALPGHQLLSRNDWLYQYRAGS